MAAFAFAPPRVRTLEDAEAAIDADGLAEGVLSLPELRIVERLLELADSIGEMKRVRDSIARGGPAQAHQEDGPRESISAEDAKSRAGRTVPGWSPRRDRGR